MRRTFIVIIDRILIVIMVLLMLKAFNLSMTSYEGPFRLLHRLKSPFDEIITALK